MKNKQIYIFAHNIEPNGISGSETILIELFKRTPITIKVELFTWRPGYVLYRQQGLTNIHYHVSRIPQIPSIFATFLLRILYGFWLGISLKIKEQSNVYIYPSSDFWPDTIPAILLKIRYPKIRLLANFYLQAPSPFKGFDEGGKKFIFPTIRGLLYWSMQQPIYYFYKYFADSIIVTSQPDVDKFPLQKKHGMFFIVKGGVNVININHFIKQQKQPKKIYDAVFMGRFHPQKGVVELIDIWKEVTREKSDAKLVMIGDGRLMPEVKKRVKALGMENNIILTGYVLKQEERYQIFMQSKIAVHPAIYDSGGMAVAEAMAFGLPGVCFDLEALKTYYPKGFLKVPLGDAKKFAQEILQLLHNKSVYDRLRTEATELIQTEWDWEKRAETFYKFVDTVK